MVFENHSTMKISLVGSIFMDVLFANHPASAAREFSFFMQCGLNRVGNPFVMVDTGHLSYQFYLLSIC